MKILKQLFCRHKNKFSRDKMVFVDGRPLIRYGLECKTCRKVWRL